MGEHNILATWRDALENIAGIAAHIGTADPDVRSIEDIALGALAIRSDGLRVQCACCRTAPASEGGPAHGN